MERCPRCRTVFSPPPDPPAVVAHSREDCDAYLRARGFEERRTIALERIADTLDSLLVAMPGGPSLSCHVTGAVEVER